MKNQKRTINQKTERYENQNSYREIHLNSYDNYVIFRCDGGSRMTAKSRCWPAALCRPYTLHSPWKSTARVILTLDSPRSVTSSSLFATKRKQAWYSKLHTNALFGSEQSSAHKQRTIIAKRAQLIETYPPSTTVWPICEGGLGSVETHRGTT